MAAGREHESDLAEYTLGFSKADMSRTRHDRGLYFVRVHEGSDARDITPGTVNSWLQLA